MTNKTIDAMETLGTTFEGDAGRDAVHVAVVPAVAKTQLYPGTRVDRDGGRDGPFVGIVDPFLPIPVHPGAQFWILLFPRTITSLRHVWSHPEFDDIVDESGAADLTGSTRAASEEWLRQFADERGIGYEELLARLTDRDEWGRRELCFWGDAARGDVPAELYDHLRDVTGVYVPANERTSYFTCTC